MFLAKLGPYVFEINTAAFDKLDRNTAYRWESLPRVGRKPAAQFVGEGEDTIQLDGVVYPHFRGGLGQVKEMRDNAANGVPLPLIYAFERLGQYAGLWCIKSIKEGRSDFFQGGVPRKIEFSIQLIAYGEDAGAGLAIVTSAAAANASAGANAAATNLARLDSLAASALKLPNVPTPASLLSAQNILTDVGSVVKQGAAETAALKRSVLSAPDVTATVIGAFNTIGLEVNDALRAASEMQAALKVPGLAAHDLVRLAAGMSTSAKRASYGIAAANIYADEFSETSAGVGRLLNSSAATERLTAARIVGTASGQASSFGKLLDSVSSCTAIVKEKCGG